MVGQTLAHYKILEKIGSGGMGDVYLAEDTKLDRKVALKVLPPELAESEERRARFQREAKAIAALDHPNIVHVYSVEEAAGVHFITMELVKGKTLAELLPRHGFPLNRFFDIAIPLADAVATAHQEGITHRDLKPGNLMVTDDGRVKVLDFGLAKRDAPLTASVDDESPTEVRTREGVLTGTLHYMSPEQAEGKVVDTRSDLFSLSVIFHELLSGERPFKGDTPASTLSAILKDSPMPLTELNPSVPHNLARMIRRCLSKDPVRRYQTAIDVRNELEELKHEVESGEALVNAIPTRAKEIPLRWILGLVTVAVGLFSIFQMSGMDPAIDEIPLRFTNPVQLTSVVGVEDYPAWSADGRNLAYESDQTGNWDIWVTQVAGGSALNRTAESSDDERFPSWGPDGREIAFWSSRDGGGLFVMSALAGAPRKVATVRPPQASPPQWLADGKELAFVDNEGDDVSIEVISIGTGETRKLTIPGSDGYNGNYLSCAPDERHAAIVLTPGGGFSFEISRIWIVDMVDGKAVPITDGRSNDRSPSWSADARTLHFVSNRGGNMDLWEQPLREDGGPRGAAKPVVSGIGMRYAVFSPDGRQLAYSQGKFRVANVWKVPIFPDRPATWEDSSQVTFDNAFIEFLDVSADGTRLLVSSDRAGNQDLWMVPIGGGEMQQLTADPSPDWCPRWSPDGREISFYSFRSGNRDIWVMPSRGGTPRQITQDPARDWYPSWSPDGRELAFGSNRTGAQALWIKSLEGGESRLATEGFSGHVVWSTDGKWLFVRKRRALWRLPVGGGEAEVLVENVQAPLAISLDGTSLIFGRDEDLWMVSLDKKVESQVASLHDQRGDLGQTLGTDGEYMYFTWNQDLGDIWVMDVVTDESE